MNILVCGGFGFAGQYVVYKLLKDGNNVILLGRKNNFSSIDDRINKLIHDNVLVNDEFKVTSNQFKNLSYVEGDLSKDKLGIDELNFNRLANISIDEIYNLAACLKYDQHYREHIFQINVDGTRRLLDISSIFNAKYFHASTAYIAGEDHPSFIPIKEEFCTSNKFSNIYIESKWNAELLIKKYSEKSNIDYLIFRFPTLIGDSKTGYTNSIYAFYEYLSALKAIQDRSTQNERIRFSAVPNGNVNLLPTDLVVKNMLKICKSNTINKIFNLTDSAPMSSSEMGNIMGKLFSLNIVAVNGINIRKDGTKNEKLFSRLTRKNSGFAQKAYVFDCQNSERALGHPVSIEWDKSIEYFKKMKEGYDYYCSNLH